MAEATLVRPDRSFVDELIAAGGGDVKKCMQCANCSVVCELSGDVEPFPRKEMIWAQWGLGERLFADPDVWLCHQCNDCSVRCPRGARPGDVLAAVRQRAIRHWAVPGFLADWAGRVGLVPVLMTVSALLMALALAVEEPLGRTLGLRDHPGFYAEFFPHWLLIGFFGLFTGLAFLAAVVGVARFWKAMKSRDRSGEAVVGLATATLLALRSILSHDRFAACGVRRSRKWAHLAAFYGFLALLLVTTWAVVDMYVNPALFGLESLYPFGPTHPMKLLANVGGVLLVVGAGMAILDRRGSTPDVPAATSFDELFVWLILGVGVTGFAAEIFRFTVNPAAEGTVRTVAYGVYFVHLVLVFQLLVYLPYSKFAHVLYRTVAMVYAEHTGRHPLARRRNGGGAIPANGTQAMAEEEDDQPGSAPESGSRLPPEAPELQPTAGENDVATGQAAR